jgi:hypothetical protein
MRIGERLMRRMLIFVCASVLTFLAGCAGISKVNYNRFDRGRRIIRVAVIAYNQTVADRYKMWAWTKRRPRVVPPDTFDSEIVESLSAKTDYHILSPEVVRGALKKLGLEKREYLNLNEMRAFRQLTDADTILFVNIPFYLQNYLFYNTFGIVEITMRLVATTDGALIWDTTGRNFALFISTDSALDKLRDKMIVQLARKLESDKSMAM